MREAGRRLVAGDSPEDLAPLRDAFFDALADDFNTARALASLFDWIRAANRREGPVGDAHLREMLACWRSTTCSTPPRGRRRSCVELAERRAAARAARDFAEADRLRDELRAEGWEVRDGPTARSSVSTVGVIVYGLNPVREALRGPRRVQRIWAAAGDWSGAPVTQAAPRARSPRAAARTPTRASARRSRTYRYADAAELLARPEPFLVALDEVTDPQNLGAVCRTAEVAGATGVILPERRSAEVTPAVCKASAGAVEHLAIAQVRNLADFLARPRRPSAGATAPRPARGRRTGRRTTAAGSSWCSGGGKRPQAEGEGCVRRPGRAAGARAHRLAQRQRCGRGSYVRDIAAAA